MGSEDARLWEDAMSSLRDENSKLKQMNIELKIKANNIDFYK